MSPELTEEEVETLTADLNGVRGPEREAFAHQWCEENGYEVTPADAEDWDEDDLSEFDEDDLADDPDDLFAFVPDKDPEPTPDALDAAAFLGELQRIEGHAGRSLTDKEQEWLLNRIPEQGPVPDLVREYGDQFRNRAGSSKEARLALMAEAAETAQNTGEPPEEKPSVPTRASGAEIDTWNETKDERIARMAAAAEEVNAAREDESAPVLTGLEIGGENDG